MLTRIPLIDSTRKSQGYSNGRISTPWQNPPVNHGEIVFGEYAYSYPMAAKRGKPSVDLNRISDPQRPVTFGVGVLLLVVGIAGLTGIIDTNIGFGEGLVFGLFGVPFWLGVTAIVAGLLAIVPFSVYQGAGTTFNKVAAGLVLPAVILLAVADWAFISTGNPAAWIVGLIALLLAVVLVVVGVALLFKRPVALVLPIVAVLTLADWAVGLTELAPASEAANLPTVALLIVLALAIGAVGFQGGKRMT